MLSIDISHAASFLSLPYEAALRPRLERAAGWLQNGGGKGSDFIGWVTLPRDYDRGEYARILAAAKKIQGDSKALVVIGIGGSYLGARGVIECLCSPNYNLKKKSTPNIYFIGNGLSSDALREVTELIGDDDFSVNVISKSGTTTEPAVAFRFFREKLEKKYGKEEAAKRIYATTDAHKGALKSLADQEGYEEFVVPDNIGGRYSVLTAVGLLPIAVAGVDLDELMGGAQEMMSLCAKNDYSNPAWQYAAMRHELYRQGKKVELLACFEPAFRFMAEWWKQLYGESEGKECCDLDALDLAAGEGDVDLAVEIVVGAEAYLREVLAALVLAEVCIARGDGQKVAYRDALEARRLLKAVADAEPSTLGDAKVRDVLTVEEDLAARRRDKAHDDLGERRLAAAVGAGEDDELAVRNVDGNVV